MTNNLFHCLLSFVVFYGIAFLLSENRQAISKKIVIKGIILQVAFAVILLKVSTIAIFFKKISKVFEAISLSTTKASAFVFGGLANPPIESKLGYILAIQGFPILILIGALSAVLTYWRILPFVIRIISAFFRRIFNIGGTLGIAASVNLFSGMSETPLIIRAYLHRLTHSELFSLMTCGTAGVASSVMILYSTILNKTVDDSIVHIINAVLISIPGALTLSRIVIPETSSSVTEGNHADFSMAKNTLDAIYSGITDGGKVMIKVLAMLIGFVALVDVFNEFLLYITPSFLPALTLQTILGWLMAPVAWVIGIPWHEATSVGSLLGTKFILNEIIAFSELAKVSGQLTPHSKLISVYVLSSFANLGSIGVMIGVYTTLSPDRKEEVIKLGLKAAIIGSLVNYLTASIVNVLI